VGSNKVIYTAMLEEIRIRFYGKRGEVMYEFSGEQSLDIFVVNSTVRKYISLILVNMLQV
jgi:hypothetical protein